MEFSNKTYNILKHLCTIILPALGALYAALGKLWGFPYITEVVGTISAVSLFIGSIIGISSAEYFKTRKVINLHDRNIEERRPPR